MRTVKGWPRWIVYAVLAVSSGAALSARAAEPDPWLERIGRYKAFFERGGFEPDLDTLLPSGYTSRWSVSAGISATYTDNLDQNAERRDAWWVDGTFGLGWLRRSPRLTGTANYRFSTALWESNEVEGRDTTRHALGGGVRWKASPHISGYLDGHVAQNLEEGLGGGLAGVRTSYANRSDEYGFQTGYRWRLGRNTDHRASYGFAYRNYLGDRAEGEDTRSHRFNTSLGWGGAWSRHRVSYGFSQVDGLGTGYRRRNHTASVAWTRRTVPLADPRPWDVGVTYTVDRGLPNTAGTYWRHALEGFTKRAWSPRTQGTLRVGYQWIRTQGEDTERGFTYGIALNHRFSAHTNGAMSWDQTWSYEPASSRTDVIQLTRTRRAVVSLSTRWSRSLTSRLDAAYVETDVDARFGPGSQDYVETSAGALVQAGVGRGAFTGMGYRFADRDSDDPDDSYRLHRWHAFVRKRWSRAWSASLTASHVRRRYDPGAASDDYMETRFALGVEAVW